MLFQFTYDRFWNAQQHSVWSILHPDPPATTMTGLKFPWTYSYLLAILRLDSHPQLGRNFSTNRHNTNSD